MWKALGYEPAQCQAVGRQHPCYQPGRPVLQGQAISFIARAMVNAGFWTQQADDPALYPNVPQAQAQLRKDLATYTFYAGLVPGTSSRGQNWGGWDDPITRSGFAATAWQALNSYFGSDDPDPKRAGGYVP